MSLEEELEDIAASPAGPQVAAFFDVDGTVLAGYSANALAKYRLRRMDITAGDLARTVQGSLQMALGKADLADFMALTAVGWQGHAHEDLEALGQRVFDDTLMDWIYPEARALVRAHQRRGHTVALTTSATWYQVCALARELDINDVLCTRLVVRDGQLTGLVDGVPLWGRGKAEAVQRFAQARGVELTHSRFYADGDEDEGLMHLVGKPRPTNPGRGLAAVATRRGWPVLRFNSRGRAGFVMRGRNAVGWLGAVPLTVLKGADGIHGLLAASGVSLRVAHAENLAADQPVVVVFNHRTEVDPLLVASCVDRSPVVLGSERMLHSPLMRVPGLMVASAVEAAAALASGRSVVAAAEGDRQPGQVLATLDEVPFRLAAEAGAPLVPIVVRNAEELGPRRARVLRSGTVDVAVLPAEQVHTKAMEGQRVRVREGMLAALDDWPD